MNDSRRLIQPTTFGNPSPVRSHRFHIIANALLPPIGKVLHVINVILSVMFLALLGYAGLFIEHEQSYASDGSIFSCQVDSLFEVKALRQ